MTTISKTTSEHRITGSAQKQDQRIHSLASAAGSLLWRFLRMQVPMGLGALICYLLVRLIPVSSSFARVYHPGTYLFAIGDILFLTVPVVVWMILRGDGWRHSAGMAIAMLAPVGVIILAAWLSTAANATLLWLITAGYPLMCLGMLVYMLYRRDHFTRRNFSSS